MIKNTIRGFGLGIILVGVMASASAQKVYWGGGFADEIRRINIDGTNEELLVSGQTGFQDIDVDEDGGKIYWIASNTIRRSNLDGTGPEDLVTGAVPHGLALDLEDGKIYFTDNQTAIRRANLDGTNVELVTTTFTRGGTGPTTIDVDTVANKIYYGVGNGSRIDRMNFDGTGLENLFTGTSLNDIRVDEINSKLYISQGGIKVSELDGTGQSTIISTDVGIPFDIDPSGEFLFYKFAPSGMGIDLDFIRSDLNGASPLTLIEGNFSPQAIAFPEPAPAAPALPLARWTLGFTTILLFVIAAAVLRGAMVARVRVKND